MTVKGRNNQTSKTAFSSNQATQRKALNQVKEIVLPIKYQPPQMLASQPRSTSNNPMMRANNKEFVAVKNTLEKKFINSKGMYVVNPSGENVYCVGEKKLIAHDQSKTTIGDCISMPRPADVMVQNQYQVHMKGMAATKFERQHTDNLFDDLSDQSLIKKLRTDLDNHNTASSQKR